MAKDKLDATGPDEETLHEKAQRQAAEMVASGTCMCDCGYNPLQEWADGKIADPQQVLDVIAFQKEAAVQFEKATGVPAEVHLARVRALADQSHGDTGYSPVEERD